MRPVPSTILSLLLAAVCALCAVQWRRESRLRELAVEQRRELTRTAAERDDLTSRLKAADGEILRLTGALADLRSHSVSQQTHDDALAANRRMRDALEAQNAAIKQQNDAITRQNASIKEANEAMQKLTVERDSLAKRLNEVTALYNRAVQARKAE